AQLGAKAGDFMTANDWRRTVSVPQEIPVNELVVGGTHSTRLGVDEHLSGLNVRNWHVLENEAFVVLPDASCPHRCDLLCWCVGGQFRPRRPVMVSPWRQVRLWQPRQLQCPAHRSRRSLQPPRLSFRPTSHPSPPPTYL